MPVASQDYYDALGVSREATDEEIRRSYRSLARRYHPDVNREPGAEDRFKQISEAYDVLRDPEKRERYDRLGANWRAAQEAPGDGGYGEGFGRTGFEDAFRAGDGFGDVRGGFGGGEFGDLFDGFFSRRGGRSGRTAGAEAFSIRGRDLEAELELSLEEAARGGKRWLSLGDGRSVEVDIPRGVRDGDLIRLAGEGSPGVGGGPPGDLLLRVRLKRHPIFRVRGRDLHVDLPVTPWEAALGAEVPVPTLEGEAQLKVPPGSSSGRRLRLRGQGLPGSRGNPAGDLYAVVSIKVPKRLSKRERELFEQLASASKFDPRRRG
jgi:curved DNA-binding protein